MKSLQTRVWKKVFGYKVGDEVVIKKTGTIFLLGMEVGMLVPGMKATIEKVMADNKYLICLEKNVHEVKKVIISEGDFE